MFRRLIEAGGTLNASDVVDLLRCSAPTARKEMEALFVLGVADKASESKGGAGGPETQITLTERFAWFASAECKALMSSIPDTEGGNLFKIPSATGIKKEFPPCVIVNGDVSDELDAMPAGVFEL